MQRERPASVVHLESSEQFLEPAFLRSSRRYHPGRPGRVTGGLLLALKSWRYCHRRVYPYVTMTAGLSVAALPRELGDAVHVPRNPNVAVSD